MEEQFQCLQLATSGHNFYIIGPAGSEKTYTVTGITEVLSRDKNVQIICSTGVACDLYSNVKTVHSYFGIGLAAKPDTELIRCAVTNVQEFSTKFDGLLKKHKYVDEYAKSCVTVCWLMVVQDPPVCLYFGQQKKGSLIDKDRFTCYLVPGETFEQMIWQAVLLHEGGLVLRKGVVQPIERKK